MFNDYDDQLLDDSYVKIKSLTAQLEEKKEKQRIAIEALEKSKRRFKIIFEPSSSEKIDVINGISYKMAMGTIEQALSTIRGK